MGCIHSRPANIPADVGNIGIVAQDQEKRIELHFKAKRQNVFTASVDMDRSPPSPKNIPKTDSQKSLISKLLKFCQFILTGL